MEWNKGRPQKLSTGNMNEATYPFFDIHKISHAINSLSVFGIVSSDIMKENHQKE